MTGDVAFRRATAADVLAFYGHPPVVRMRGIVAEQDGRAVMLGGVYYHDGIPVVFSELKPEARKCRKAIARGVRIVMDFAEGLHPLLYAIPNMQEPTSVGLLCRLGFRPTGVVTSKGEYFVREPA